jgi:trehalose 6-phosphate phosphatase
MVGLDELAYAGNHGLELLRPGEREPRLDPSVGDAAPAAQRFASALGRDSLDEAGLRLEDKGPIQALHWRGAADETGAERRAEEIGAEAARAGLDVHRGRLVLELRPRVAVDKGVAVRELIATAGASAGLYAGDDRTDLDAFAALRALAAEGILSRAVCVGVASTEGPDEIQREADLVVGSSSDLLDLLRTL